TVSGAESDVQGWQRCGQVGIENCRALEFGAKPEGMRPAHPAGIILPRPSVCIAALVEEVRIRIGENGARYDEPRAEVPAGLEIRRRQVKPEARFVGETGGWIPTPGGGQEFDGVVVL